MAYKVELLQDPVGKGLSEALAATVQHVRLEKKEIRRSKKTVPLNPYQMETRYTVLSAELSKLMDREERSYQKIFCHSICGQSNLLNSSTQILDAIQAT